MASTQEAKHGYPVVYIN